MNQRHDELRAKREARQRSRNETNRTSVDVNIDELRQKRAALEEEITVSKETNDQIRAQVRRETEELRQLDMIRRRNIEESK